MRKLIVNKFINVAHRLQKVIFVTDEEHTELCMGKRSIASIFNDSDSKIKEDIFENDTIASEYSFYLPEQIEYNESSLPYRYDFEEEHMLLCLDNQASNNEVIRKEIGNWGEILPELMSSQSFQVVFLKEDKTLRSMQCIFDSARYIAKGILTVYDIDKQDYRSVNLNTMISVQVGNKFYEFNIEEPTQTVAS